MKSSLTPPPNAPPLPVVPFNPDEKVIDLTTSCSREDAAAKLLGWLRGPMFYKYIEVTSAGITVDQLKHISSLEYTSGGTLASQLTEFRQAALIDFYNATDGADQDEKSDIVVFWNNQIHQAAEYLRDIDDELDKEDDSTLKIDKRETERLGKLQIRLSSLDLWSKDKYKFSIFDDYKSEVEKNGTTTVAVKGQPEKELKSLAATNLYAAFALLVEDFATNNSGYATKAGKPINSAIAKHIAQLGKDKNRGEPIRGMLDGAITDHINEAFVRLNKKLENAEVKHN